MQKWLQYISCLQIPRGVGDLGPSHPNPGGRVWSTEFLPGSAQIVPFLAPLFSHEQLASTRSLNKDCAFIKVF
jgi:hypothetical protein